MILKNPPISPIPYEPGTDVYVAQVEAYRVWFRLPVNAPEERALAKIEAFKGGCGIGRLRGH